MVKIRRHKIKPESLLLILPFIFYSYTLFKYNINFPRGDDIDQILLFIKKVSQVDSFWEQLKLTFEPQATGHIIATQKIVTLLIYIIVGSVNIKGLIILGNFCFLTIFFILYRFLIQKSIINTLMLCFCMVIPFNLLVNWAGTSLNQGLLLLFAILSFYHFSKGKLIGSFVMATLALCSLGNGLAVYASIILLMILDLLFREYNSRKIINTAIFGGGFLILLLGYSSLLGAKGISFSLTNSIQFVLCFLGGFTKTLISSKASLLASGLTGLSVISILIYVFLYKREFFFKNSFIINCLFFLIITAALASLKRPLETSITDRYQWYHSLSLALTVILTLNYFWTYQVKNGIIYLIPFLSISFWDRIQDNYTNIIKHNIELKESLQGYYLKDIEQMPYPSQKAKKGAFNAILFAEHNGFYTPPPIGSPPIYTMEKNLRSDVPFNNKKYETKVTLNQLAKDYLFIQLEVRSLSKEVFNRNTPAYIQLEHNEQGTYYMASAGLKDNGRLAPTYSFVKKLDRKVLNISAVIKLPANSNLNNLESELYLIIAKGQKNQFKDRIKLPPPSKKL